MIPLPLELIEPLGRLTARPWTDEVSGVQIDSRRIEEGDLFRNPEYARTLERIAADGPLGAQP